MMMRRWLARPLRRFAGTAVMVAAAHAGSYRALQARPELPPAGVDRVEVTTMDGSHTITDGAAVARIVAIVRSHRGEWSPYPGTVCLLGSPGAAFYQGATRHGSIVWGPRSMVIYTRRATAERMLSPRDAAELERLLSNAYP